MTLAIRKRDKALAWGVHLYTASGAVCGVLALLSMVEQEWRWAFIWMYITIVIDSMDGALARRFRVKEVVPTFDGALLDNMVDYFTYVLVPAIALYQKEDFLPPRLILFTITLIIISSAYQFCQSEAKTDDHYFKGFPSYWNIVIIYLIFIGVSPWINFATLLFCAVMVFVPIKYVYPSRTPTFRGVTLLLSALWVIAFLAMIWLYPHIPPLLINGSLLFVVYYFSLSLYLTYVVGGKH